MNQNDLRQKVKLIKALYGKSYKEISKKLGIKTNSLYNYLRGQYDLSDEKVSQLESIIAQYEVSPYEQLL